MAEQAAHVLHAGAALEQQGREGGEPVDESEGLLAERDQLEARLAEAQAQLDQTPERLREERGAHLRTLDDATAGLKREMVLQREVAVLRGEDPDDDFEDLEDNEEL